MHLGLREFGHVATSACFVHVHLGLSASLCSNGTGTIHTVHLGLREFGHVATSACFVHVHLGLSASLCSNGTGTIHTALAGPHTQLGVG